MIVIVIIGITLGAVAFNALPDARQTLQNEAQRIALLLQLARDEAIVRNRPVAFELEPDRYRFLVHEDHVWQVITQDDLLRERRFKSAPLTLSISPPLATGDGPLRIVFGREPVDKPFVLTLSLETVSVAIRADGIGHFVAD
ncbi:MAG: type II secretion system protein GspH [Glaciimonas sp.]|nr:type II secretion system protein GspH [Glaciimonas sp.]